MVKALRNWALGLWVLMCVWGGGQAAAQNNVFGPVANGSYPRAVVWPATWAGALQRLQTHPLHVLMYRGIQTSARGGISLGDSYGARTARTRVAKNAAFMVWTGLAVDNEGNFRPLSGLERDTLGQRAIRLLEQIDPYVQPVGPGAFDAFLNWQYQVREYIQAVGAYDLLRGIGYQDAVELAVARERLIAMGDAFYQALLGEIIPSTGFTFLDQIKNNHAMMSLGALGLAAVVLTPAEGEMDDPRLRPEDWVRLALYHIDNIFWRDSLRLSEPDSLMGFAEGPHYLRYTVNSVLPFFRGLQNFLPLDSLTGAWRGDIRRVRQPLQDPAWQRQFEWIHGILLPDGSLPPIEDSFVNERFQQAGLAGLGKFNGVPAPEYYAAAANDMAGETDNRADYLAANPGLAPSSPLPETFFWPVAGNLVFRSSRQTDALYLHVIAEYGRARIQGYAHDQADNTSLMLYLGGTPLLLDPGYIRWTRRTEVNEAQHHNLLLINNCGPPAPGPATAGDVDALLSGLVETPLLRWADAQAEYCNARVRRRYFMVDNQWVLSWDRAWSPGERIYTHQLHGHGHSESYENQLADMRSLWRPAPNAGLMAHVVGIGTGRLTHNANTSQHEVAYDQTAPHTVMLTRQTSQDSAAFIAVMWPSRAGSFPHSRTFDLPSGRGVQIGSRTWVWAGADSLQVPRAPFSTTPPAGHDTLRTDAQLTLLELDVDARPRILYLQQGTSCWRNGHAILSVHRPMDVSLQQLSPIFYHGYVQDSTTLVVQLPSRPYVLGADALDSLRWDPQTLLAQLYFRSGSQFQLLLDPPPIDSLHTQITDPEIIDTIPLSQTQAHAGLMRLGPNPTDGPLHLQLSEPALAGSSLQLTNMLGQTLWQGSLPPGAILHTLDLSPYPSGLYTLHFTAPGIAPQALRVWRR